MCLRFGLPGIICLSLSFACVAQPPPSDAEQKQTTQQWLREQKAQRDFVNQRLSAAGELRAKAKSTPLSSTQRVSILMQALKAEMAEPTTGPISGTEYTASEMVRFILIWGLAEVNDPAALNARVDGEKDPRIQDSLAIAALMASAKPNDPDQAALIPRVIRLLAEPTGDFIGHLAAQSLGKAAPNHRSFRSSIVDALTTALNNRISRPDIVPYSDGIKRRTYLVRQYAGCALLQLGLDVRHDDKGRWWLTDKDPAVLSTWWVDARKALTGLGYAVTWDPSVGMLTATRGADTVSVSSGKKIALVNGRDLRLKVAPRVVGISLQVPEELVSSVPGANVLLPAGNRSAIRTGN